MPLSFNIVRAGEYLTAVAHIGSPLGGVTWRDLGTESERARADGWMIEDLGLRLGPASTPAPPVCATAAATAPQGLRLPRRVTLVVHAGADPADVSLRRLARRFPAPLGQLPAGSVGELHIPRDQSSLPWYVRVRGAGAAVSVCP